MQIRLATSLTAAAVLMCSLATTARPAAAAVITFEFTGTSNTFGREVFGENGELVPYSYSFIYDTSLGGRKPISYRQARVSGMTFMATPPPASSPAI